MLAKRTRSLRQSDIRAISKLINDVDGINLGQGICDIPVPDHIKRATKQAVDDDKSIYSHYAGAEVLRERILRKVQGYNKIPATSVDEIVVGVGATGVFVSATLALLDAGDEVILFEPYYGYHRHILELLGCNTKFVRLEPPDWDFSIDALRGAITSATKAIILTTPSNPCGKVWSESELAEILHLAQSHELTLITDEIYEYILYDGVKHVSLASLDGAYERTVSISGFSKTYNMTGWRLGYATAAPPIADAIGLINDLLYICAPTPLQHGVVAAFDLGDDYYDDVRKSYDAKRSLICKTLEEIGFDVPWPQGAYYVLADFGELGKTQTGFANDQQACETMIHRARIGTIPGSAFYADPTRGNTKLRFCFAKELEELEEACRLMRHAFASRQVI